MKNKIKIKLPNTEIKIPEETFSREDLDREIATPHETSQPEFEASSPRTFGDRSISFK